MARDDRCEGGSHYGCKCSGVLLETAHAAQIAEVLHRYLSDLYERRRAAEREYTKDIDYITKLLKLLGDDS